MYTISVDDRGTITQDQQGSPTRGRGAALLLAGSTTAVALMAGFFYAYACSVMVGLSQVDDRTFIATMQSINATVRNVGFGPAFFGAAALPAVTALVLARRRSPATRWVVVGLLLYVGAFVVTMALNVPLNEQLAAAGHPGTIPDPAGVRGSYERPWVRWNLVRAVLCTAAPVALVRALLLTGRWGSNEAPGAAVDAGAV